MKISTQIKLVKVTGVLSSAGLVIYGFVSLASLAATAGFIGDFAIILFLQSLMYFLFSAAVYSLTNLGCLLLERAFKDELIGETASSQDITKSGSNSPA